MVKKILSVFAIASMMLATSCSNDEFDSLQNGKESTVTFTAQLPDGLQTKSRAYGDGETATRLQYMAYLVNEDGNWTPTDVTGTKTMENKTATVNLKLVNGNTYKVVFWADAGDGKSIYDFDTQKAKVTADYEGAENNDENFDAFFKVEEIVVSGTDSKTVELKRPFAQLNIGTADLKEAKKAGRKVEKAAIKVNAYKTLNFKDEKVGDEAMVEFELAALPSGEDFPYESETYKYLTMNYLLMGDKESKDVVIRYDDNAGVPERTIQAVPLQRNYRTNVYGNLLTSQNNITVTINSDFNTPDYPVPVEAVTAATLKDILVSDANGVININKNYVVTDTWKAVSIGNIKEINGNGHTISGLTEPLLAPNMSHKVTIKNLTIDNSTILGDVSTEQTLGVGAFMYFTYFDMIFENCHVTNTTIKSQNTSDGRAAGLIGYAAAIDKNGITVTISDCSVEKCKIEAVGGTGGLMAYTQDITNISNSKVVGTTVESTEDRLNTKAPLAGGVIGTIGGGTTTLTDVTVDGNTVYNNNATPVLNKFVARTANDGKLIVDGDKVVANGVSLVDGVYCISNAEGLTWFEQQVNKSKNYFSGKTIKLVADIDLNNINWVPIGQTDATTFGGTFDGNGKTIYNLKVTSDNSSTTNGYALFGWLQGTVKNLTIDGANINASHNVGVVAGYVEFGHVENCTVKNATITANHVNDDLCGDKVGGIAGYLANQNNSSIKNCKVENSSITAGRDAGQVVGCVYSLAGVSDCYADNVSLKAASGCTGANMSGIIGRNLNP